MHKLSRFSHALLMVLVLASLLARPAASAPLAQLPDPPDTGWEYDTTIPDSYEQVGANANFALLADPATLGFKVIDLRSGYIWHATLDEVGEDDRLNRTWTAFASSGISINYMDLKATEDRASITNAEHTMDYQTIENGFQAVVTFTEPSITVTVQVVLDESGVSVSIPFDGITEADADYRLSLLYVYPFFAAAREDQIPGYMFMPDGSGSLVRFRAETKARNMFYGRYYGDDLGMLAIVCVSQSGELEGDDQDVHRCVPCSNPGGWFPCGKHDTRYGGIMGVCLAGDICPLAELGWQKSRSRITVAAARFYEALGGTAGPEQSFDLRGQTVAEVAYRFALTSQD